MHLLQNKESKKSKEHLTRKMRSISLYPRRFFKVFLPHQSSHRMKFPSAFIKYLHGTIPFKATITSPTRSSWKLHVEKIGDDLSFHKGREEFVECNSLEFGDFLVFSYDGYSNFRVRIYGRDGCEKEPSYQLKKSCQIVDSGNSEELEGVALTLKQEGHKSASEEANKFKSHYPFFKIAIKSSYVVQGPLNIPGNFVKKHMSHMKIHKTGVTFVCSDKSWPVNVILWRTKRSISGGWASFSKDNALKVGDICVFELIDRRKFVFKVSIFRCSY